MRLRLSYPPIPENAPKFAEDVAAAAAEISGETLDYSIDSLQKVETIVESFRSDGLTVDQIAETLFGFGCYVGEVFVKNAGGTWKDPEQTPMAPFAGFPLVVQLSKDTVCDPIGKVFRVFDEGGENALSYFYRVFTSGDSESASNR